MNRRPRSGFEKQRIYEDGLVQLNATLAKLHDENKNEDGVLHIPVCLNYRDLSG